MLKKIILIGFVFNILLTNFHLVYAQESITAEPILLSTETGENLETKPQLQPTSMTIDTEKKESKKLFTYPSGEKFKKLESLVEEYLIEKNSWRGKYKWNIKYNEVIEKEIKLIIMETYEGNEEFYKELFLGDNQYYYGNQDDSDLKKILNAVPRADIEYKISALLFNDNFVTKDLLGASFGVEYKDSSYDSFLDSVKRIIENYKNRNGYYPNIEDLGKETIYKDFKQVPLSEFMDEIDYKVITWVQNFDYGEEDNAIAEILELANNLKENDKKEIEKDLEDIKNGQVNPYVLNKKYINYTKTRDEQVYLDMYSYIFAKYFQNPTYSLNYKKTKYTYEEALEKNKEIEEKKEIKKPIYKDYKKLIWDTKIQNIPEIYKKIPSDSMFFHISNPEFIFQLLENKNTLVNSSSGIQILQKLKDLSMEWFDIEDWNTIKENLKHDFVVIMSDIDLSSPNIIVIIHKEDKWVLVPWKKPKVAVTVWDYIYIASSEKALDKFRSLKEENSIYMSDDFRYVWMKKQSKKKDLFFFVWDKFFEKLISFDNYIKMKRKINDYMDLYNLQNYVWAYGKIIGERVNDFEKLAWILSIEKKDLDKYTIDNSIVEDKKIGVYWNTRNVDEIDYDLSTITREELQSYQRNILKYKEVWRANLDPLWVIINNTDTGFDVDFFMTPIPNIQNYDFGLLVSVFSDLGLENLNFIKNPKLRIWTLGTIFAIDVDKAKQKINSLDTKKNSEAKYFKQDLEDFNKHVLWWDDLIDYIGGEFMLSFGGIDESILRAWDTEKLDLFLAVEFKNKLKAKEFIKKLRDAISKEIRWYDSSSIENKMYSAILKPMVEDYNGEQIYIIPIKDFFFPITIYYTILDNYLYISVSKVSIQKTIDYYVLDNHTKSKFAKDNYLGGTKLLYAFFDSDNIKSYIDKLMNSNMIEDLYIELKWESEISQINPILLQIKKFYHNVEYSNLIWKEIVPLNEKVGILEIKSKWDVLYLKINKDKLNINNKDILKDIESLFDSIDPKFFQWDGADIAELLSKGDTFKNLMFIGVFDSIIDKNFIDNLFTNMSFSFDIGNDEIQLQMNAFQSSKTSKDWDTTKAVNDSNKNWEKVDWKEDNRSIWNIDGGRKFMNDKRTYLAFGIVLLVILTAIISTSLKRRKK